MARSAFLTKELIQQAVDVITPGILAIMQKDETSRKTVCILAYEQGSHVSTGAPLWQGVIGEQDKKTWEWPFDELAKAKAHVASRTGMDTHLIAREAPHLYEVGDSRLGGGVARHGLIVAASGLAWSDDLMIASMIAEAVHAKLIGKAEKHIAAAQRGQYTITAE